MYKWIILKRWVEAVFIFPFALLGKLYARLYPLKEQYDIFFFFPFYHVGGAERVHATLAQQFPDKKVIIFFTKKSVSEALLPFFEGPNITIRNISKHTGNKWLYWMNLIWRGVAAEYINRQSKRPSVFNGQCNFAYKLSPHIRKDTRQVELLHSLCSFSYIRIPFIPFYTHTVMISHKMIAEHKVVYEQYAIPAHYFNRIQLIINGIDLPQDTSSLAPATPLQCLYAGRGDRTLKRVHLVAALAKRLSERQLPVQVNFMGDVEPAIPEDLRPYCNFLGEKTDAAEIDRIFRSNHLTVILSVSEGFPMAVAEAMARGLGVLSTSVGDVPYHVKEGENGLLLDATLPEEQLADAAAGRLAQLLAQPELLTRFAVNNITYARAHFGKKQFAAAYRALLI